MTNTYKKETQGKEAIFDAVTAETVHRPQWLPNSLKTPMRSEEIHGDVVKMSSAFKTTLSYFVEAGTDVILCVFFFFVFFFQ